MSFPYTPITNGDSRKNDAAIWNDVFNEFAGILGDVSSSSVAGADVRTKIDTLKARVDTIVASAGTSNTEIVDARGNYSVLNSRLAGVDALPGAARLGAGVSAAATSMTLRTAPNTVGTNLGWAVIDPFTTECEVRKVASISGTTVNFHSALTYAHSADDAVLIMSYPHISVEMFGAKGDGATDDTTAIQRALNAAAQMASSASLSVGGIAVHMGPGIFYVSTTIDVPNTVQLVGSGRGGSSIRAMDSFSGVVVGSVGAPIIQLGPSRNIDEIEHSGTTVTVTFTAAHNFTVGQSVITEGTVGYDTAAGAFTVASIPSSTQITYIDASQTSTGSESPAAGFCGVLCWATRLENIYVSGRNVADVGVYSRVINELSGLHDVTIYDCRLRGVLIENARAQNYTLRGIEIQVDANLSDNSDAADAVGLYIDGGAFGSPRGIDDITSNCYSGSTPGGSIKANIQLEGCNGFVLSRVHTEHGVDGILIGDVRACTNLVIEGYVANGQTNIVRISDSTANTNIVLNAIDKGLSGTNLINDEINGITITSQSYAHYSTGTANFQATATSNTPLIAGSMAGATAPAFKMQRAGVDRWSFRVDDDEWVDERLVQFSFASGATIYLGTGALIVDIINASQQTYGRFFIRGATNAVSELSDAGVQYTTTKDTASSINCYYDGGASPAGYYIQNNTGGARNVAVRRTVVASTA